MASAIGTDNGIKIIPIVFPTLTCVSFCASEIWAAFGDRSIRSRMNAAISTLAYRTPVTTIAMTNRITAATRNRGRERMDSNVRDGSKNTPVRVSAVDISGPVGAVADGGANESLISILLRIEGRVRKLSVRSETASR